MPLPHLAHTLSVMDEIERDTQRFIAETMADPDMVQRSDDFREGYAKGFSEAVAAFVAREALRNR